MLMIVKRVRQNCGKLFVVIGVVASFMILPFQAVVGAQSVDEFSTGASVVDQCGGNTATLFSVSLETLPDGEVYVRTNAAGLRTKISVFIESVADGTCKKIDTVTATDKAWARVGSLSKAERDGQRSIILASPYLGADAYASVATVLFAPKDLCRPKIACDTQYEGVDGAIEPVTISGSGELVTVQTVTDISGEKIERVEYFDDGEFLYTGNTLSSVDQNYLRGGDRTVKKVAYLTNDRKFTATEQVAMPSDPLYSQYIKSSFYRLSGQTKLILVAIGTLLLVGLFVYGLRRFHAWRTYRNGHGIETYLQTHHDQK
ncbi:hypothetical protein KA047_03250 [Candidatus Saccharibacteria bacterium]|nr:hypothetical protein [Candidatus Saccharibacteria bacterium]